MLSGGLVAVGAPSALAAPPTPAPVQTPAITIAARSLFKPVTGDVFVEFLAGKFAKAQIHGTSRPVAGGARRFTRTLSWSFWTGVNSRSFVWVTCSKDTETADGLGCPATTPAASA